MSIEAVFPIRFQDVDAAGVLFFGRIYDYCHQAYEELWAAAGFFKIRLSPLFRNFSNTLALAVAGFWFYESIKTMADGFSLSRNANFFSRCFNRSDIGDVDLFGRLQFRPEAG